MLFTAANITAAAAIITAAAITAIITAGCPLFVSDEVSDPGADVPLLLSEPVGIAVSVPEDAAGVSVGSGGSVVV